MNKQMENPSEPMGNADRRMDLTHAAGELADLVPRIMGSFMGMRREHPRDSSLTMRQYQALILLHAHPGMHLGAFCVQLGLAPSTGTELINRLISQGYVSKTGEHSDRRLALLTLTDEGKTVFYHRQQGMNRMFHSVLSSLSPDERSQLVSAFSQIWSILKKID